VRYLSVTFTWISEKHSTKCIYYDANNCPTLFILKFYILFLEQFVFKILNLCSDLSVRVQVSLRSKTIQTQVYGFIFFNICIFRYGNVVGSISHEVTGIFHWFNPSDLTMALGSSYSPTGKITRDTFWGKVYHCIGPKALPPSCAHCLEILGIWISWSPKGL